MGRAAVVLEVALSLRRLAALALCAPVVVLLPAPHASAASGHITDPSGDLPDIRRLTYDNAPRKVDMTVKFASVADAQNRSFYMQWGKPKKYQVFDSPSAGITELRFYTAAGTFRSVSCDGLRVAENTDVNTVRAVVPRSCISKAPDRLRFKAIATLGLSFSDETSVSPWVKRG
jgi:hypothetical protein